MRSFKNAGKTGWKGARRGWLAGCEASLAKYGGIVWRV